MSRIEPGGFEDIASADTTVEADHPIFDQDWKERLNEARAKRDQVLSKRKAEVLTASPAGPLRPKQNQSDATPEVAFVEDHADVAATQPSVVQTALRSGPVYKLLLAFSAATGIGLGVTLGIGALGTFGGPNAADTVPATAAAVPQDAAAITAQPLQAAPDVAAVSVAWAAPVWTDQPSGSTQFSANLPEITAVQYVSATTSALDQSWADSLPSAPALPDTLTDAGTLTGLTPRFFVHVPNGVPEGKLQAYIAQVESEGLEVGSIGRESFRVSTTHLRYYSPAVADAAHSAAAALGVEARDFSQSGLQTGRIEIWIAGRPKARANTRTTPDNPIARFFGRLTQASN